ncbi:MAG: hypothetical protein RI906_479 [Pseudomonadota bacterium]|jgi:hypothetical protein
MAEYSGLERRHEALTEDKVALMIQDAVSKALTTHEQHLTLHMDKQFALLRQTFAEAFPGGDPHGHRIAHEKAIKNATAWDKMKAEVLSKFLTAGLWVAAGWLALAVWEAFKHEVKK